jgi:L-asparagine oxygenase
MRVRMIKMHTTDLANSCRSEIDSKGYCFVPRFGGEQDSAELANIVGVVELLERFAGTQTLTPHMSDDAAANTYSGNFGLGEFPLHTDLAQWAIPPHFVFLRCRQGAREVPTRILDGNAAVSSVGIDELRMALVQPRRPMSNGKQLLRLLERFPGESEHTLRWDYLYLRPTTEIAVRVFGEFKTALSALIATEIPLVEPGDTLVIDNWRCLHGRAPVSGSALNRRIDRVYLKYLK